MRLHDPAGQIATQPNRGHLPSGYVAALPELLDEAHEVVGMSARSVIGHFDSWSGTIVL